MSHRLFAAAFVLGLLALGWVGFGFIATSPLALLMTVVIAAVYLAGAWELRQFRAATATLRGALEGLSQTPAQLADWLERVPAALRPAVRTRVEGERGALPGPSLAPYLVGLLVMLGMLGTFLGMVVTFKGAVFALQGSTDLQAIRAALAEPIRGLALSFGTSVAGVAASAMLGLMSALARRERLEASRLLDQRVATVLQPFSQSHHQQETLRALQAQADALPQVVTALHGVVERIEQRSMQLDAQLLDRQAKLQRDVTQAYEELARKVGASLQENLAAHTQAAGRSVQPVVEQAMARMTDESQRLHQRLAEVAQQQADTLREEMGRLAGQEQRSLQERAALLERVGALVQALEQAAGEQKAAVEGLVSSASSLLEQAGAQAAAGASGLSALSQASTESVRLSSASHDRLSETLQRVEASLVKSTARSDEQLAYYVAQAREVIDLSLASQEGLIESLRQLQGKARPLALADEARA